MHIRDASAVQREEIEMDSIGKRMLFHLIEKLFPEEEILTHHQPKWLIDQVLEIYLPYSRIAFEYQGVRHLPAGRNGDGSRIMEKIQERDRLKILECHRHGVLLITIPYTEPMTLSHIRNRLQREGSVAPRLWSSLFL